MQKQNSDSQDIPQNSENKPQGLSFSKALFEGLIFGASYIQRGLSTEGNLHFKIDWASLILFLLCFTLYLRVMGAYIWRGDLTEGFFALPDWGAYIWRGIYMEGLIFGILRYILGVKKA